MEKGGKRRGGKGWSALEFLVIAALIGLLLYHVLSWHRSGAYGRMYEDIQAGRAYLAVLYNLALILVLGTLLGQFMEKLTELVGYEVTKIEHFE